MKRLLALILSLLLCLSLLPGTVMADEGHYDDVPSSHWAYNDVEVVTRNGLMQGYGSRRFGPADQLTVAQVAQVLCNARGEETAAANGFWAYGAVVRCRDELKCLPDRGAITAENYDVPVSRELAVYMLVNGMELHQAAVARELTLADLPDGDKIAAEYRDAILTAYRSGLVLGTDAAGTFCPKGLLSRAEGAALFARLSVASNDYRKYALGLAALPELPEEPDESALWEQIEALDYAKLGPEGYQKAYSELWNSYSVQSDAYRAAVTALRGEGVDAALTPALARYTLRTARQLAADETEKNVVYSPANLYLALCMLAETTGGESRAQILNLLGLNSVEQMRSAANALWRDLYRSGANGKTLLANSIWLNEQFDFHEDTVDTLSNEYYASTFRAPMGDGATDAAIHEWINENTNHLLEDAANGLQTDVDTLMMLISTLYFKGTWSSQFNEYATSEDIFTAASGAEQRIEFMHSAGNGTYYRGENFIAASLPFRDGTAMWFLLPDAGVSVQSLLPDEDSVSICIDAPEGTVQDTAFGPIFAQAGYAELHWSVPKFDVDSDLDLIPALQALGVTDVFIDGTADFSPLTDVDAIVSSVKHAARVKVNEEGCEAAAFTAIMVETTALPMPQPVVEINLNRPFAFLITGADGLPLFAGVVNTME